MRMLILIAALLLASVALADDPKNVTSEIEAAAKAAALNPLIHAPADFGVPKATEAAATRGVRLQPKCHVLKR